MQDNKKNIIVDLTFQFALDVIEFCELLEANKKFVLAKQLLRAGTSVSKHESSIQSKKQKRISFQNRNRN